MTASAALADSALRTRVTAVARTTPKAVIDALRGFPLRGGLAGAIRAALEREGVDLGTIATPSAEAVERWREARRVRCKACAAKDAELANLRAEIARLRAEMQPHREAVELAALKAELRAAEEDPKFVKQLPITPTRACPLPIHRGLTIVMPDGEVTRAAQHRE